MDLQASIDVLRAFYTARFAGGAGLFHSDVRAKAGETRGCGRRGWRTTPQRIEMFMVFLPADMGCFVTEKPDTEGPLVVKITVEIITYTIYFSWLSVIAAGALYLGVPPLPFIQDAVGGSWQGTAAAIALGALSIAVLRVIYEAIRARMPQKTEPEPPTPPQPETEPPVVPTPAVKRTKKKKKKRRGSRRR